MKLHFFKNTNLFTIITKLLIIVLPFYVIIKVYFDKNLGFGFFGFLIKEFLIVLLFLSLIYEYFFNKKNNNKIKFDGIDYLILFFIIYGILITILNGSGFANILYGGRYDFLGFIVFLIFKHGYVFLKEKKNNLINLFLLSASISLFFGIFVKFILGEEILSFFGFTIQVTEFGFGGGIPMYQGVEASGIRRFQGILDSPLSMGYFLILFTGLFLHINKKNIDFSILLATSILFIFIFLTYSRAAMLGVIIAGGILFILNLKYIFTKLKKIFLSLAFVFIIVAGTTGYIFQDKLHNVFFREGSTNGHFTRMSIGIDRFYEKPFGAGLASSGPAYRNVIDEPITLQTDRYYIPESWFIQILVEGGFIYLILFFLILGKILLNLFLNNNIYIFLMFIGVLVMNIFLHVFEYTYLTILLFIFIGIFYSTSKFAKN